MNKIKLLAVSSILLGVISTVNAGDISILWGAAGGFYFESSFNSLLGSETGNSALAQLIYSADGVADVAGIGGTVSGDDVIWASYTLTEGINTSEWGDFSAPTYNGTYSSGNLYARIFQTADANVNDWYYISPFYALLDTTAPQTIQMNTDTVNGDAINGVNSAQVVPEPATALLLGIGGGIAWLIRLKQRLS